MKVDIAMTQITPLENEVLEWLLAGEDPVLDALRQQFAVSTIKSRESTGVGWYINFDVPDSQKRLYEILVVKQDFCFGDVDVGLEVNDGLQEVGFLLWVKDGYLDYLEAYTYGFETWPEEIKAFHLRYLGDQRDLSSLRRNWEL
jgi:hypothetical protein